MKYLVVLAVAMLVVMGAGLATVNHTGTSSLTANVGGPVPPLPPGVHNVGGPVPPLPPGVHNVGGPVPPLPPGTVAS